MSIGSSFARITEAFTDIITTMLSMVEFDCAYCRSTIPVGADAHLFLDRGYCSEGCALHDLSDTIELAAPSQPLKGDTVWERAVYRMRKGLCIECSQPSVDGVTCIVCAQKDALKVAGKLDA
jgi:hypothetical protein